MAGVENLIYHERQQPGSMLCAQHALNSLLQGNYFTAPDLSDIAKNLDLLERSYDEAHRESTNMDDTGFFSVQVLENALKVWGLNLTRWRGEGMRPYQDSPHTQLAFILNLDQHWFTLRRFGHAESNIDADLGNGHWFNLNSALIAPEWVGKTYLGMVLQQAESDGYSVFAVTQIDPSAPLALPRTEADEIASTLPEPTSVPRTSFTTQKFPSTSSSTHIPGFEDEDYELQAALQASLAGNSPPVNFGDPPAVSAPPPLTRAAFTDLPPSSNPASGAQTPNFPHDLPQPARAGRRSALLSSAQDEDEDEDAEMEVETERDPVAASMARNRLMLQRMREEQEYAQRELWADTSNDPEVEARRAERRRAEEEEAEHLRRAIDESEATAREEGHYTERTSEGDDAEHVRSGEGVPSSELFNHDRVYDDDDAELQAALKASLEHVPDGWIFPERSTPRQPSFTPSGAAPVAGSRARQEGESERGDVESIFSDETELSASNVSQSEAPVETVSVDELRKRRLARFGA